MTRMPFLVERAMVTVLRACIHMFDREDMAVRGGGRAGTLSPANVYG